MTPEQLKLLIEYISNEIYLAMIRSAGMPWQTQLDERNRLIEELTKAVSK